MNNGKLSVINIISFVSKSNAFEWVVEGLKEQPYHLVFILLNQDKTVLEDFLIKEGVTVYRINYTGKKTLIPAFLKVAQILLREKADVVHCHLFDACVVGLSAARLAGVKKRVYTRHNSTIHHVYFPKAVKYDRFINHLATHIIAISEKVRNVLLNLENVPAGKIYLVPHGFDFRFFETISQQRIDSIKHKYALSGRQPVIGVVSRYMHWKGIQYIIPAFKNFLEHYPHAVLVLANADGPYKKEVTRLLTENLTADTYREIVFEDDIFGLFKTLDLFIHVPVDDHSEAFGQVYVEALASGIPSIVTLSGIALEFIKDRKNALVVGYKDSGQIYDAMMELSADKELYNQLKNGGQSTVKVFDIGTMVFKLNAVYQS